MGMYVHGSSLTLFLRDEAPIELNEDLSALWRMFYRTGGLSARLFQNIIATNVKVCEFKDGDLIPTTDHFYILYVGHALLEVVERAHDTVTRRRVVRSGEMFDLEHLGMFHRDSFFTRNKIRVKSVGHTKLFCFHSSEITKIANHRFAKSIWQALLISNLSIVVESYNEDESHCLVVSEPGYCNRIFRPLEDYEEPNPKSSGSEKALSRPLRHILFSIVRSFSPPFPLGGHPSGMRQTLLSPPSVYPPDKPSEDSMVSTVSKVVWLKEEMGKSFKSIYRRMSSVHNENGGTNVDASAKQLGTLHEGESVSPTA